MLVTDARVEFTPVRDAPGDPLDGHWTMGWVLTLADGRRLASRVKGTDLVQADPVLLEIWEAQLFQAARVVSELCQRQEGA